MPDNIIRICSGQDVMGHPVCFFCRASSSVSRSGPRSRPWECRPVSGALQCIEAQQRTYDCDSCGTTWKQKDDADFCCSPEVQAFLANQRAAYGG